MHQNFVFVQLANLNDLAVESMLSSALISPQVITESANFTGMRQQQFVACRYLLAEILNQYFDVSQLPQIIIADNSRPQFAKTNLPDFNISHSGNFVAVAVSSQGKIGLDIEVKRDRKNYLTIAKQFFSPQENNWLNQQNDRQSAFWQLWTLRESALKLYAKGVWQMKAMQITMPQQHITADFGQQFHTYHQTIEPIYLSICCNNPINQIEIN